MDQIPLMDSVDCVQMDFILYDHHSLIDFITFVTEL